MGRGVAATIKRGMKGAKNVEEVANNVDMTVQILSNLMQIMSM